MNLDEQAPQPAKEEHPGWRLTTGTVLLVLLCMVVGYRNTMLRTGNFSAAMGGAAAPLFWSVVVALLFSISKRFRNRRSQTKVVLWTLFVCLLAGVGNLSASWNQGLARAISAGCPKMIDAETRMEGATAGPGNLITITETAIAVDGSRVDRTAWRKTMAPQVRTNALKAMFVQRLLAKGMSITLRYTGRDGVLIGDLELTPADLQK